MTTPTLSFDIARRVTLTALRGFLDRHSPDDIGPIHLAVSGGTDSVALLLAVTRLVAAGDLDAPLSVLHVDHRQHARSQAAAHCVEHLAHRCGLSFQLLQTDLPRGCSEDRLREARLAAFRRVGTGSVWTAHHADDQLETLWFRARRGTGRRGLAGIPERRALAADLWLGRPLLAVRRAHLVALLEGTDLEPFEDPTNADLRFERNRIRQVELPRWRGRQSDPERRERQVLDFAGRVAGRFADREALARVWLAAAARRRSANRIDVTADPAAVAAPVWIEVGRLLHHRALGRGPTDAWLARFADLQRAAPTTRLEAARGLTLLRTAHGLELDTEPQPPLSLVTERTRVPDDGTPLRWGDGFEIRRVDPRPHDRPLWIRPPQPSDRLPANHDLAERPGRPLRDLLRIARVPLLDRPRWPVVTDAADRPLWTPTPADQECWSTAPGADLPGLELRRPSGGVDLAPLAYWLPSGRSHPSDRDQDKRPPEAAPSARSANQSAWII